MVDTVEIGRVTLRDTLSLDLSVWMNHPDDWDFRPQLSYAGSTLTITCANQGTQLASVDLDDEQDEAPSARPCGRTPGEISSSRDARSPERHPPHYRGREGQKTRHGELEDHPAGPVRVNPQRIFHNGSCRFVRSCLTDKEREARNEHDSNDLLRKCVGSCAPIQVVQLRPSWRI